MFQVYCRRMTSFKNQDYQIVGFFFTCLYSMDYLPHTDYFLQYIQLPRGYKIGHTVFAWFPLWALRHYAKISDYRIKSICCISVILKWLKGLSMSNKSLQVDVFRPQWKEWNQMAVWVSLYFGHSIYWFGYWFLFFLNT